MSRESFVGAQSEDEVDLGLFMSVVGGWQSWESKHRTVSTGMYQCFLQCSAKSHQLRAINLQENLGMGKPVQNSPSLSWCTASETKLEAMRLPAY